MSNDPRLERYLSSMEKALKPFPVSDRAEIITEIKSHILAALDRDPNTNLDSVLKSLGEPETVSNRYLLERGLQPAKTSIHPIFKWMVIGFLGTFAILVFGVIMIVWSTGPIVKIDGNKGRVQVLGGLIDIDGEKETVSINGMDRAASKFTGSENLNVESLTIKFNDGHLAISTSDNKQFSWSCKADGITNQSPEISDKTASFDLSGASDIHCSLRVPQGVKLNLSGNEGHIVFTQPRFAINAEINEAKINFLADRSTKYSYAMKIDEGKAADFESSNDPKAYAVNIHLKSGKIAKED